MSLLIGGKNGKMNPTQGIKKAEQVPLGLIMKSLKDSIVKAFEKSVNILLTDFRLKRAKTRQNPPNESDHHRIKTDKNGQPEQ